MAELRQRHINSNSLPFRDNMDQYIPNTEPLFFDSSFFPEYTYDNEYIFDNFNTISPLQSPTDIPSVFPIFETPAPEFPPTFKEEPTSPTPIPEQESTPQRTVRRGRPRLNRTTSDQSSCSDKGRIAHKQVERKYREGLNAELDRLRRSIPTLPRGDEGKFGHARPSKTMVLASAIDYIQKVEQERKDALRELEQLRQVRATNSRRRRDMH